MQLAAKMENCSVGALKTQKPQVTGKQWSGSDIERTRNTSINYPRIQSAKIDALLIREKSFQLWVRDGETLGERLRA